MGTLPGVAGKGGEAKTGSGQQSGRKRESEIGPVLARTGEGMGTGLDQGASRLLHWPGF